MIALTDDQMAVVERLTEPLHPPIVTATSNVRRRAPRRLRDWRMARSIMPHGRRSVSSVSGGGAQWRTGVG